LSINLSLTNKRAVVCGSSQGIGRAVAIELASSGAELILIARNREKLEQLKVELHAAPGVVHAIYNVDLSDYESLREVTLELASNAPVHILINNSGGPKPGPVAEATPSRFADAINGHLAAYQILVQALLPGMRASGYGRIINILSTSVIQPLRGLGVSNSLRAAVANWGRTLAAELGADGITVNNVLPGMTRTERLDSLFKFRAESAGVSVEQIEQNTLQYIPAARFGRPEEIAWAVAFLASPAASYINGISLPVDGGRLACQ
jgi:3-oxoacyl-[acyl-carrier protein] reductase